MSWLKSHNISTKEISLRWVPLPHSDPYWRVYWNQNEGATIITEGESIPMMPDRVYVLPSWLKFQGLLHNPVLHSWMNFRTLQWNQAFCRIQFNRVVDIGIETPKGACMVEFLKREFNGEEVHEVDCEALAHLALGEVLKKCPLPTKSNPLLEKVVVYIQENLGGDLRVENLARIQRCSAGHLSRLFQKHLGASPAQIVRENRISYGADRLLESRDSIDSIAEDCGFSNRFHFSRVFREVMHMAPAAFRKHHWGVHH